MAPLDDGEVTRPVADPEPRPQRRWALWQELVGLFAIALVVSLVLKAFFLQAFYIPSSSMSDTLVINDRILVEKVSTWTGEPHRGDIVVFSDPGGWLSPAEAQTPVNPVVKGLELFGLYPTGGHLVKRVIGVGGDHVVCCDDEGRITVNGSPLYEEQYLPDGTKPSEVRFDVKVPPGFIWVQGDNRAHSYDSRGHLGDPGGGFIPVDDVVGRVVAVIWPLDRIKIIHRPATFDGVAAAGP
jgi:signal peptidase I